MTTCAQCAKDRETAADLIRQGGADPTSSVAEGLLAKVRCASCRDAAVRALTEPPVSGRGEETR